MKAHAVAMLSSFIILIFHRHAVAIGRRLFRCFRRRNRHGKRWQSECKQEYRKKEVAEHSALYHVKH
jgi:hypothetical protein